MGSEIVKVPPNFEHPKDDKGEYISGAHAELLYNMPPEQLICFQIYQNISEGTPISPIFQSQEEMKNWLADAGYSSSAIESFIEMGHAPMLVIRRDGAVVDGIEGMKD